MGNNETRIKRRRPGVAGLLSVFSLGLGQIYNGELRKGVALKGLLWLSIVLFAVTNFKSTRDLLFFVLFLLVFLGLKVYSIVQAFRRSRTIRSAFMLRGYNRAVSYALLIILTPVVSLMLYLGVTGFLFNDMSEPHPFRNAKAKVRYLKYYDNLAEDWPVDFETRMISGSFGQTFVRISGPREAPPLVLVPGAGAHSLMWIPNIEALAGSYRVYALDNIFDYGRSVYTKKIKTPRDFTDWMDELFATLDLGDRIYIMGLSYGGWLTSQYALHHSDRVAAAVMLAPASTVIPLSMDWVKRAVLSMIPHPYFLKSFLFHLMEDLATGGEEGRAAFETWGEGSILAQRCFKFKSLVNPTVLTEEEWGSLRMPVLFVVGENERIYDPHKALERLKTAAPHIRTLLIPGTGHDLSVFKADLVNQKVLEFMTESELRQ